MRYALMTVFLFGAALFGATTASAHPGHGGGPGHIHSHNHGSVIIYRSNFVSPYVSPYYYNSYYYQQPVILHGGHLHGHNGLHNHGGLFIRTGGLRFGIHH